MERWTAVCRPLKSRITGSATRVRMHILLICSASLLFVFPRFFEYECIVKNELPAAQNVSSVQNYSFSQNEHDLASLCEWHPTKVAQSAAFSVLYGVIAYALLAFLLPVGIVLLLNSLIIAELSRPDSLIAELTLMQKYERKISKVPLCVAIVFCILQTPALIINVIHFSGLAKAYAYWDVVLAISGSLISANSTIDFLVCFYNIGGLQSMRVKHPRRMKLLAISENAQPERSSRNLPQTVSSDVRLNETTRKRWFIVSSLSAQRLTMHHSETVTSKTFKDSPSSSKFL